MVPRQSLWLQMCSINYGNIYIPSPIYTIILILESNVTLGLETYFMSIGESHMRIIP